MGAPWTVKRREKHMPSESEPLHQKLRGGCFQTVKYDWRATRVPGQTDDYLVCPELVKTADLLALLKETKKVAVNDAVAEMCDSRPPFKPRIKPERFKPWPGCNLSGGAVRAYFEDALTTRLRAEMPSTGHPLGDVSDYSRLFGDVLGFSKSERVDDSWQGVPSELDESQHQPIVPAALMLAPVVAGWVSLICAL